jgi:alkylhydroperoxidase family enzyme
MADGSGPRVQPTTEDDWDDETRTLVQSAGGLNIFTTLANHPKLMKRWLVFGNHVLSKSSLDARDRELLILRTGWRCHSEYEFGQHTIIGERIGLTGDEIERLTADVLDDGWSASDRTLIRAVDELVDDKRIGDDTWAALNEGWSLQQVMDLVFTVGQYVLVSMALNSFGVELDDGVPGFPGSPA